MNVLEEFKQATQKLIEAFCEKQEMDFDFFVAGNPAELASFNLEYYFNISDIYHDLATNQQGLSKNGIRIEWITTTI